MSKEVNEESIARSWTHVHEEDSGDSMMFRPSESDLPPARGRTTIELGPGGKLQRMTPGPDDRRVARPGSWSLEGNELTLQVAGQLDERYQVEKVDEDRLVLRKAN